MVMTLTERLRQLSKAVCEEKWGEFSMRVPPDTDRDADFVLLRAADEIAALRQQLAAALAAIKVKDAFIEKVAKQTPEKPDYWTPCGQCEHNTSEAEEALAATADLDGLILCHAEPCRDDGRCQYAIDHGAEGLGHCPDGKCCMPLYLAWEPTK